MVKIQITLNTHAIIHLMGILYVQCFQTTAFKMCNGDNEMCHYQIGNKMIIIQRHECHCSPYISILVRLTTQVNPTKAIYTQQFIWYSMNIFTKFVTFPQVFKCIACHITAKGLVNLYFMLCMFPISVHLILIEKVAYCQTMVQLQQYTDYNQLSNCQI